MTDSFERPRTIAVDPQALQCFLLPKITARSQHTTPRDALSTGSVSARADFKVFMDNSELFKAPVSPHPQRQRTTREVPRPPIIPIPPTPPGCSEFCLPPRLRRLKFQAELSLKSPEPRMSQRKHISQPEHLPIVAPKPPSRQRFKRPQAPMVAKARNAILGVGVIEQKPKGKCKGSEKWKCDTIPKSWDLWNPSTVMRPSTNWSKFLLQSKPPQESLVPSLDR